MPCRRRLRVSGGLVHSLSQQGTCLRFKEVSLGFNPFTLRAPPEPNVCYFHTFENNLRTKRKFTKYLKESCSLASGKHFFFICFPENAFVSNIFPNLSGLFFSGLSVNGLSNHIHS